MKRIAIGLAAVLSVQAAAAQQTEGKVIYERTIEMQIRIAGMPEEMQRQIPRTRTDKIEVSFANNQSLRKQLPQEETDEQVFNNTVDGGGQARGGVSIRMMGAGADDATFTDLAKGTITDQRELGTKKFLVSDSINKLNWKLTGETRTILGYACQQATAQRITMRMQSSIINGQIKREEMPDTANITAWFTPAIPVAAGPEVQGQLPGLILAIDINNGRTVYKAVEVSPKVDVAVIKEPKGGKKITQQEFREEQNKLMQEMQRNNGGRGATFRMAN
jgi:GLPGLI family protein